jgi:predicted SnoaL-like aldol condensation-catalyzing enzyme
LVYDFWRSVLEGGHLELAPKYMLETYIQHNPNVPTGRKGFIDFFSRFAKARPIADTIKGPLIAIVAEGDSVVLSFKDVRPDPKDPAKTYITTSFEMLRIENGKVAEHWDSALKE